MKVYRFQEKVAITPPDGPTFYLDPFDAQELASYLCQFADDCQNVKFEDSVLRTREIETTESRNA